MGTKAKKIWKTAVCGIGLAALAAAGVFLGIRLERDRQETIRMQEEHVSAIAVVNMDNGVDVGDRQVNYAAQLLSFPNGNFTVTGLTDAKTGIGNGRYAAYIVIPETFSESVTSVENDPAKVTLSYQYNAKLGEEAKLQAVSDVNAFMALFNSNIAYMYMDAIMAEFHRVQDDSGTILENDDMELELVAGIDAEGLIASAEPVEEPAPLEDIEPVELAGYFSQNGTYLDGMLSNYSAAVQKGKDEYDAIKEESAGVEASAENFFSLYDASLRETEEEQARSLEEGRDKLTEAVGLYNQSVDNHEEEMRAMAESLLTLQLEADREAANAQLKEIVEEVKADLSGNDPGGDVSGSDPPEGGGKEESSGAESSESGKEAGGETGKTEGGGSPGGSGAGESPEDAEKQYEITLSAFGDEEAINRVVGETLELFHTEAESEKIDAVVRAYFVDALSEEGRQQRERLSEEMEAVLGSMEVYEGHLAEFDPMEYIEEAGLESYLGDIDGNAGEMLEAVEQNNADYMLYSTELYTDTTEHTERVRAALDEANAQTIRNVVDCMNDLALSREETNSRNVDMLKGFTESLAYTRVGSQANVEVYDMIINPVVPRISGEAAPEEAEEGAPQQRSPARAWPAALLGAAILLCLAGITGSMRHQYRRQKEADEEAV